MGEGALASLLEDRPITVADNGWLIFSLTRWVPAKLMGSDFVNSAAFVSIFFSQVNKSFLVILFLTER